VPVELRVLYSNKDVEKQNFKLRVLRIHFIFLLTLAIYLQGCAVIKDVESYKTESLDKNNYSKLNGMYSNIHSDTTVISYNHHVLEYRPKTLWCHTYSFNKDKEKGNAEAQIVRLEFKTHRKILLSLFEKDSLISNRVIRGRIKDGFFYRKPHFVLIPLIPIAVFSYDTYGYRIGLVKDGLVIDYKWNYWGFALLAGGTGKGQTSTTFKKQ
jgi:hypothetical protein